MDTTSKKKTTKLSHLTDEEKRQHRKQQQRESKLRQQAKNPAPARRTNLDELTDEQRREHRRQQQRASKLRKQGKDLDTAIRVYSAPQNLSNLTSEERADRKRAQRTASYHRNKNKKMSTRENRASTPTATSETPTVETPTVETPTAATPIAESNFNHQDDAYLTPTADDDDDEYLKKLYEERQATKRKIYEEEEAELKAKENEEYDRIMAMAIEEREAADKRAKEEQEAADKRAKAEQEAAEKRAKADRKAADERMGTFIGLVRANQQDRRERSSKKVDVLNRDADEQFKTMSARKASNRRVNTNTNTETKRRVQRLVVSQQAPLEDSIPVVASPDADHGTTRLSERMEKANKEAKEEEKEEEQDINGVMEAPNDGDEAEAFEDAVESFDDAFEEEPELIQEPVRAVDLPVYRAPPLKSAFSTPSPRRKSILSIVGSGLKKARARVSFGSSKSKTFTPPDSHDKKAMHGASTDNKGFYVVITDLPTYQEWREMHEAEFVNNFNRCTAAFLKHPKAAKQILHAARVMELLPEVDIFKLRKVAVKIFPNHTGKFPAFKDHYDEETIAIKKAKNLERLHYCLRLDVKNTRKEDRRYDRVTLEEKGDKVNEADHLSDSSIE